MWEQRVLRVRYQRWRGEVRREIRPLGIVLKSGIWYAVAQAADDAVRTYRISRFGEVEPTPDGRTFERPVGFDLAAYWAESTRRLESWLRQDVARVRLSPAGQRLLPAKFGVPGERALAAAGPPDGDGWVETELEVESELVAVSDLLSLGAEAEVVGPPSLRAAMLAAVSALSVRYRSGDDRCGTD